MFSSTLLSSRWRGRILYLGCVRRRPRVAQTRRPDVFSRRLRTVSGFSFVMFLRFLNCRGLVAVGKVCCETARYRDTSCPYHEALATENICLSQASHCGVFFSNFGRYSGIITTQLLTLPLLLSGTRFICFCSSPPSPFRKKVSPVSPDPDSSSRGFLWF